MLRSPLFAAQLRARKGLLPWSVPVGPVRPRRVVAHPCPPRGRRVLSSVPWLQYGPGDAALMALAVAARLPRRRGCCSAFAYSVLCVVRSEHCDVCFRFAVILPAPRPLPRLQYGRGDNVPVAPVSALCGTALGAHWLAAVVRISGLFSASCAATVFRSVAKLLDVPAAALATVRPWGQCAGRSSLRSSRLGFGRGLACCRGPYQLVRVALVVSWLVLPFRMAGACSRRCPGYSTVQGTRG